MPPGLQSPALSCYSGAQYEVLGLGGVIVDYSLETTRAGVQALGLVPGTITCLPEAQIRPIRGELYMDGVLKDPQSGGSIANTLSLLGRARFNAGLFGTGGDDEAGRIFKTESLRAGVPLLNPLRPGLITGFSICFLHKDGENTIVWTQGANASTTPEVLSEFRIARSKCLVIDGYAMCYGDEGPASVAHAASLARRRRVDSVLTMGSKEAVSRFRPEFQELLGQVGLLAGNLGELACLMELGENASLEAVLGALRPAARDFLITLGAEGSYARVNGEEHFEPAVEAVARDTVGAGDAFLAGFLAARIRERSLAEALRLGSAIAAEVVQRTGARLPEGFDVAAFVSARLG